MHTVSRSSLRPQLRGSVLALGLAAALLAQAAPAGRPAATPADAAALGTFGIELSNRDTSVKPGDDFDRYANGRWFDGYQLKDYETRFGSFNELSDRAELQTRAAAGVPFHPAAEAYWKAQGINLG